MNGEPTEIFSGMTVEHQSCHSMLIGVLSESDGSSPIRLVQLNKRWSFHNMRQHSRFRKPTVLLQDR
jgi:hypothetical protein